MYESAQGDFYGMFFWIAALAMYFYFSFAQYKMAQKTGHTAPWWAFIPILNTFQLIQMAGKEWYWFLFCLVPIVNVICFAILWANAAKACHHAPFWGVLMLLPFINFVAVGVLGFTQGKHFSHTPPPPAQPRQQTPAGVA